tara:strand:+ start:2937 stop:3212 length:276 start_codon:yes stop_codon:yes gene_type:complete
MIRERLEQAGLTGTDALFYTYAGAMDLATNGLIIHSLINRDYLLIPCCLVVKYGLATLVKSKIDLRNFVDNFHEFCEKDIQRMREESPTYQ